MRLGLVSVPWSGVPPRGLGSVAHVAHEVTRRLDTTIEATVVGGTWGRAPERESPRVEYVVLADRADRWAWDRLAALGSALRRERLHPFHRRRFHPRYAARAARHLARSGCECAIAMVFPQWIEPLRAALPRARLLWWCHDTTFAGLPVTARALELVDGVIGCSRFVAERTAGPLSLGAVENGVDLERFHLDPSSRREPGLLAYVGRITPEKGVHVLVEAFARLARDRPGLELHVAGPAWVSDPRLWRDLAPALRRELAALCEDYRGELLRRAEPFGERVRFLGPLAHPALCELYRRATVLVHPALWEEPFGMPVIEAMACGAPVVATRRGALPELVEDDRTGVLVEAGEAAGLARSVGALLDDPPRRERLGRAAARLVRERFTWEASARQLEAVLRRASGRIQREDGLGR